jgi:hypothetical protein
MVLSLCLARASVEGFETAHFKINHSSLNTRSYRARLRIARVAPRPIQQSRSNPCTRHIAHRRATARCQEAGKAEWRTRFTTHLVDGMRK